MTVEVHTMPATLIDKCSRNEFRLMHEYHSNKQIYQQYEQRSSPTDVRWKTEFDLTTLDLTTTQRFQAFYDKVMAKSQYFTVYDPVHRIPRGGCPLAVFEDDLFQGGIGFSDNIGWSKTRQASLHLEGARGDQNVIVQGLQPSAKVLGAGDRFSLIHNCLPYQYEILQDIWSDASGIADFPIQPVLRDFASAGQELVFIRPRTVMQFMDSAVERGNRNVGNLRFSAQEVYEIIDSTEVKLL